MNNIKLFIDIFGTIIDAIFIFTFFSAVADASKLSKKTLLWGYIGYCIVSAAIVMTLSDPFAVSGAMLLLTISVSFFYRSSVFSKIFSSTIIVLMIILAEMLVGLLLSVVTKESVEVLSKNIIYYIQGVIFSKVSLLALVKIVQYRKRSSYSKISKSVFIPIFALPVSTILIIYVIAQYAYSLVDTKSVALVAVSIVFLVSSNILVFYLFEKQLRQDEAAKKSTLIQQQLQYQTQYYRELAEKYKLSNKTIHDTKNQLFAISAAISGNDINAAKRKIDDLCKNAAGGESFVKTGNEALDALINTKYKDKKDLNIKFKHNIAINAKNKIDNIDLCIIIGNALDNAIEACAKIGGNDEKEISLTIKQANNYLAVEMTNPASEPVKKVNGKIASGKKEKELHGFGMQSMEEIVNKYNGNLNYSQNGGVFSLKIYVEN